MATVIIGNGRIDDLAADPVAVKAFPFLGMSVDKKSGGCCGKTLGKEPDYKNIRNKIAAMPKELMDKFKAFLGTEKVILFLEENQQVVEKHY